MASAPSLDYLLNCTSCNTGVPCLHRCCIAKIPAHDVRRVASNKALLCMLGVRSGSAAAALKGLLDSFRAEGLPLLGVKGHRIPFPTFNVEQHILQHATATNGASNTSCLHHVQQCITCVAGSLFISHWVDALMSMQA